MRTLRLVTTFLALVCAAAGDALAHEVRPGFLELREIGDRIYDVLWKVPARGDKRLGLYVRLPDQCKSGEPSSRLAVGAYLERWRTTCDGGLIGGQVEIEGLSGTRTDVLARVERADGTSQTVRLTPSDPVFTVSAVASHWEVIRTYFALGVEHILLGLDHLLFVLALLFLVRSWPRLIGTVTAFTLAHSLTLAAATLGWVHVPQAPVEAVIALSIIFIAAEILNESRGQRGLASRKPWIVAFVFGLLHGLGFAGALRDVGLPEHAIPLALAFFNIGVETGQLLFISGFFAIVWASTRLIPSLPVIDEDKAARSTWSQTARLASPSAFLVGTLASFWLIERTVGFWV